MNFNLNIKQIAIITNNSSKGELAHIKLTEQPYLTKYERVHRYPHPIPTYQPSQADEALQARSVYASAATSSYNKKKADEDDTTLLEAQETVYENYDLGKCNGDDNDNNDNRE